MYVNGHQIEIKIQFFSHSSHISRAQCPNVATACPFRQCRHGIFSASQKILLDSTILEYDFFSLKYHSNEKYCSRVWEQFLFHFLLSILFIFMNISQVLFNKKMVPYVLEKIVYVAVLGWIFLSISVLSSWFIVCFRFSISFLGF